MSKSNGEMMVHIELSITVSESDYSFYDPKAYKNISFTVPREMFTQEALAKMIGNRVKDLEELFPTIKAEYEAKIAKEEAERAAKEKHELTSVEIEDLINK